jgi:hypothetical protein
MPLALPYPQPATEVSLRHNNRHVNGLARCSQRLRPEVKSGRLSSMLRRARVARPAHPVTSGTGSRLPASIGRPTCPIEPSTATTICTKASATVQRAASDRRSCGASLRLACVRTDVEDGYAKSTALAMQFAGDASPAARLGDVACRRTDGPINCPNGTPASPGIRRGSHSSMGLSKRK